MTDKKDLRGSIAKMRDVAQLLSGWADDLESSLEAGRKKKNTVAAVEPVSVPVEDADAPVAAAPAEAAAPVEAVASVEAAAHAASDAASAAVPAEKMKPDEVRAVLAAKCAAGFRAQVQAIINSFGAAKFSEVPAEHYPVLLEMVNDLGGEGHAG